MKQESESAPRVATRRTIVFRFILEKLPASRKLLYAVAYVLPLAHTRARGSVLSLSIGERSRGTRDPTIAAVTG